MNPIFYHHGGAIDDCWEPEGWYFWTETWADYVGPYNTEEDAKTMLKEYAEAL